MCKENCNHQNLEETNSYFLATLCDMIERIIADGLTEGQTDLLTMFVLSKVPVAVNHAKDMKTFYTDLVLETDYDKKMQQKTLKIINDAFNVLKG